jgi:hypothetical protein
MAHVSLNHPTNATELLRSWRHRARLNQKAHYVMVHRAEFRVFWFGVTSAVISGVVGLLILITKETQASDLVRICAGGVSIFASVVTAIATSGKWSEKAAQHHAAAAAYGNVHRRFEQVLAVPPASEETLNALIDELRKDLEAIPMNAPPIPESVWKKLPDELTPSAKDGIQASVTARESEGSAQ